MDARFCVITEISNSDKVVTLVYCPNNSVDGAETSGPDFSFMPFKFHARTKAFSISGLAGNILLYFVRSGPW